MKFILPDLFYIDYRALKVFRIFLSLTVIYDTVDRFFDLQPHYSNVGVLPVNVLFQSFWSKWNWSVLTITNDTFFLASIFGVVFLSGILLLFGYKTRVMTLICWIGVLSIQNRNPLIYQGGDDLLRMLLFWSIFLPLSRKQFIAEHKAIKDYQYSSIASAAILCQILFPFFFSGLFKDYNEWWKEGSAVYYAFSLDQIARPLATCLVKYYNFTVLLTRIVYFTELFILPLFLLPFFKEQIRTTVFLLLVIFNLGIISTLMIGIFPLCFLAASVLFIPTLGWNCIEEKLINLKLIYHKTFDSGERTHQKLDLSWLQQSVLGFLFILIILLNVASLPSRIIRFPNGFDGLVNTLKLNQSWGMFAPTVLKEDGWLVIKAELNDASIIDLNSPSSNFSYIKPKDVLQRFKNDRWRKYYEQIVLTANSPFRHHYCSYLIKSWNKNQPVEKKIKKLSIIWMKESTNPYPYPSIATKETLVVHERMPTSQLTISIVKLRY